MDTRKENMMTALHDLLDDLRKPFHPSQITWKPGAVKGERAMAMAYADLRAYMNRLDEVCGSDWSVAYEPWGNDRIICKLTICGVTRSSTGEMDAQDEKGGMGGTVAEAQAMKRAAAMFGLGRYLYNLPSGWADYDPATKKFTEKAKAKLMGILVQHYRRATDAKGEMPAIYDEQAQEATGEDKTELGTPPHQRLWGIGKSVFGPDWDMARAWLIAKWTAKVSPDNTRNSAGELSDDEKTLLGDYMNENIAALQKIWPNQKAIMLQATGA